ncbi:protein white-like isoform X2 [Mercenaria mercenaria]|uniref:protein white-like isoform X2 n=1 Tax=Mercenaria mercenaria TaxID=6596 RepID=UPI00234F6487|nr:protein white-like isoform X2 [Mercenaria mercenaria]
MSFINSTMTDIKHDDAVFIMDDAQVADNKQNGHSFSDNKAAEAKHHRRNQGRKHGHNAVVPHEAQHSMVDSHETVTLSWENVNVYVKGKSRVCCRGPDPKVVPKHVLRNVYGHVKPGTLLAIIGASGSGKTTLLNTLTSRINPETLTSSGDIKVNGIDVGTGIRNISAYVQQDDLFIATMTVKEHLTFRALLRMEKEVPRHRRLERVDEVIQELGLQKCQNNMIGNPGRIKGISGGEMRRLSFASEILTNPPLLFCDEPTSGLDSFMAENIVQTLKNMADKGKTVVCTIHQPSSEVFALFHHVLVMAEGRVAFLGDAEGALSFYKSVGYPCPVNYNPADFYIMTMAVVPGKETECKEKIEAICDKFSETANAKAILEENKRVAENPKRTGVIFEEAFSSTSRYEAPWYMQFGAVFARSWKTTIREPMVARVRVIQTIVLSLVLGLIYLQLDVDQKGVQDINGVLFLILTNMTFTNVFGVLNSFPLETPIFLREYSTGLYRVDIYFLCKNLAELPSFIIIPIIFCAITYWMVGLYATFEAFVVFTGVILLVANTSVSFGYIVSTAANSVSTALAIAPPCMIPLLMFGGFFLNSESIPVYFIWLEYLSWFKYANELISVNQWENIDSIECEGNSTSSSSQSLCLYRSGDQVIKYLNFDKDNLWIDVGCLIGMMIAYRLIAFIILFIKARKSKK